MSERSQSPGNWQEMRKRALTSVVVGSVATSCVAILYLTVGHLFGLTALADAVMNTAVLATAFFVAAGGFLLLWPWRRGSPRAKGVRPTHAAVDSEWFSTEPPTSQEPIRVVVHQDCGRCLSSGDDPHGDRRCVDCGGRGHRGPIGADLAPGTLGDALMRYALACERYDLSGVYSQEGLKAGRDRRAALATVQRIRATTANRTQGETST